MKVLSDVPVLLVRDPEAQDAALGEQLDLLSVWLRSEGVKLQTSSFDEALEQLRGASFRAVVMDLRAALEPGYALLAALRQEPSLKALPAIALVDRARSSANLELTTLVRFQKQIAVPVHPSDLVGAIVGLLPEPSESAESSEPTAEPTAVPAASRAEMLNGFLKARAARNDMRGLLQLLNSTGPFRYTSILRFDGEQLASVWTFDREAPDSDSFPVDTKIPQSYCSLVQATNAPVSIPDVSAVPSLETHPARHTVLSYCGVPLHREDESFYGTLCHFDLAPRLFAESTVKRLEDTAQILKPHLSSTV